jgi:IQ calmodulin-binding motif
VKSEEKFRSEVQTAKVDWSKFPKYPRLRTVCENLLRVVPERRWTALQVLSECQIEFAIDVQRIYRGHHKRLEYKRRMKALVKIQALVKAWLSRLHYRRDKLLCRDTAAMIIQKRFRAYQNAKNFVHTKRALMKCQANVLTRQIRRSFLKLKIDTVIGQALIRRYLAFTWFQRVQQRRHDLENHMENINEMIQQYNYNAKDFKGNFAKGELAGPLKYLESFEEYEMTKAKVYGHEKSNLPNVVKMHSEIEKIKQGTKQSNYLEEEKHSEMKKSSLGDFNEDELKKELGERYTEYKPMMDEIRKNLKKVSDLAAMSKNLNIRIQHPYTYR